MMGQYNKIVKHQQFVNLNEIKKKAKVIAEKFDPEKIILFGSYATGNPTHDSDVDLLVIMNNGESTFQASVNISLAVKHSFPMDIIVRTPEEIDRRLSLGDFLLKEIMEKGKVLYERAG
jgi:predicted nucleotidyltransferase